MCVIIKRGRKTISKTYSPISAPWAVQTNKLLINSIFKNISKNFIGYNLYYSTIINLTSKKTNLKQTSVLTPSIL